MENKSISCPACSSESATLLEVLRTVDQYALYSTDLEVRRELNALSGLTSSQYDLNQCNACGLQFSWPMEAPSGEWYSYAYNALQIHASSRWEFSYVVDETHTRDIIGEIGCGTGIFLSACKTGGIEASGIDFSASSIETCISKELDASVFNISSDHSEFDNKIDVISTFHVIEHLIEPSRIFEIANAWGKPQSTLWVAIPSNRRIDRLVKLKHVFDEPPHHLTKWNHASLQAIGARNGWKLADIIYDQMNLRQRLYTITTNSPAYKIICSASTISHGKWLNRVLRYLLYPWTLLTRYPQVSKLTGHSMLAKYIREQPDSS